MLTIINIVYTICVTGVILEVVLFLGYDYGRPRDCEFLWFVDNGNLITPTGIVDLGEKYCKCRYSTKVIIYILFSCIYKIGKAINVVYHIYTKSRYEYDI